MPYDKFLAERITRFFQSKKADFIAKKMMGGLMFMVEEKMCCGIHFDKKKNMDLLMARIGEDAFATAMTSEGCHPMDFTGRPMKGYVFIDPTGFDMDEELESWLQLCLDFNPKAQKSKKKKK